LIADRAEAAADDQQRQRSVRPANALRRGTRNDRFAHGLPTHSTLLAWRPRIASGKPSSTFFAAVGQHAIGEPGDGVRVVQHERFARRTPASAPGTDANPPNPSTTSGARGG
jgi:hypothetical protein